MTISDSIQLINQKLTAIGQSIVNKFTTLNKKIDDNNIALNQQITTVNTNLTSSIGQVQNASLQIAKNLADLSDPVKARQALSTLSTTEINQLISTAVNNLINGAPAALDTITELATAMGNDPNFAQTMINALAKKADKTGVTGNFPIGPAVSNTDAAQLIQVKNLLTAQLSSYVTQVALSTALGNYATSSSLADVSAIANKASSDASNALMQLMSKGPAPIISTAAPTATDGRDGDVWFQI